mgnify:CR=1 FL=1
MATKQETIDGIRELESGFMTPDMFCGAITVDMEDGPMPSEDWLSNHCPSEDADRVEDEIMGYLVRLSASGYMDCTDWIGPFDTEEEAWEALVDTYCD